MISQLKYIFLIGATLIFHCIDAQDRELDSLRAVLLEQPSDTNRVNNLLRTAWIARGDDPQAAMKDAQEAKELSAKLGFGKGEAMALSTIGVLQYRRGDLSSAAATHLQALRIRERIGDANGEARSCINLGNIYSDQRNNELALEYYIRAQEILEEGSDYERLAIVYLNIGGLYLAEGDNVQARHYSSLTYQLARKIDDPLLEAQALNNEGVCFQHLNMLDSAAIVCTKSYQLAEANGEKTMMVDAAINIGNFQRMQGKKSEAVATHRNALEVAFDMGYVEGLRGLYESLADDYKAMGDYENAFESQVLFKKFSDSIYNEENSIRMAEIAARYDEERKDLEVKRMNIQAGNIETQKNYRLLMITAGAATLALILIGIIVVTVLLIGRRRDRITIESQQSQIASHQRKNQL
jgi:tetratricopeptide (TPR) repeat protein